MQLNFGTVARLLEIHLVMQIWPTIILATELQLEKEPGPHVGPAAEERG